MQYTWVGPSGVKITASMNTNNNSQVLRNQLTTKHEGIRQPPQSPNKKMKRYRSAFTTDQINYLEKQFQKFPYIGSGHRKEVSVALNIPERAVKIWFQNRRMKEKRDSMTKECDSHKPEEFGKQQLNNVRPTQSPNEPLSLPILVNKESFAKTFDNKLLNSRSPPQPVKQALERSCSTEQTKPAKIQRLSSPALRSYKSPDNNGTAQFSIDLCKKYKQESVSFTNKPNMRVVSHNGPAPPSKADNTLPVVQDTPEDLSSWKKPIQSTTANVPRTQISRSPGYVPIIPSFYAQSYLPPGNMLWKPVNVMPIMSTGASAVTISSNPSGHLSVAQDQAEKRCCNCDCHLVKPVHALPMSFPSQVSPQYILATMPFQGSTSKY